jgi:hypothetical protein
MTSPRVASARQVLLGAWPASAHKQVGLEHSFFQSLRLPNGARKTTAPARLTDVDRLLGDYFRAGDSVHLLDVGISSGVTTLDLLDSLRGRGVRVSGVGTDICVRGYLSSVFGIDVLYDSAGHVLQLATRFFTRGRPDPSQRSLPSRALRIGMFALELPVVRRWAGRLGRSRTVDLLSPRLFRNRPFQVIEHDIARPMPAWDGTFDVLRAANVLNLDCFPADQIVAMFRNMAAWLKVGGVIVICRTSDADGRNHGSLYRKVSAFATFEPLRQVGDGFELDETLREEFCR